MRALSMLVAGMALWVALGGAVYGACVCPRGVDRWDDRAPAATCRCVPDTYDESQSHPLRLFAYAVHPLGFAAEWLIARPLHFLVSRPYAAAVFGHRWHSDETPTY